ncbi:DUF6090 family protein [Aegicerativicinus sediminis]|uniref:DUF6090 family protein n=1 Tax=Aegicerativicinus sediminis TaxID=2893202 RepID=UPI001E52C5F1|nr:DUF6090 family protein [Aegicerativicinus sediminis]
MIKFFRKIRQKMLAENKFGKYLTYAIGEIVLVVIGILIALQINNWNQERLNKKQEHQILSQLLKEYTSNLKQINQKIEIRKEMLNSCFRLLQYQNEKPESIDQDSLDAFLFRITIRPTFDPELSVSNELINSGKLYLIENTDLRNNVSSYSSFLSELNEEELAIFDLTEKQLIPFLRENYQIGRMMMVLLDDKELRAKITMGEVNNYDTMKNLVQKSDYKNLLSHPDFEDYLLQLISYTAYTNDQSTGVKEKTTTIIDLIRTELKK